MAGFSDEELQASIDRFLERQLAVPTTSSGSRDVVALRDSIFAMLTAALLLRPDSYFYVLYLAKNKLQALVIDQLADLQDIIEAAPNSTRQAKPIGSTADLVAARAATLELGAGLNTRRGGVRGSIGPAVERFRRSISRFVSTELTKNVVDGSDVIETGPEIRTTIGTAWARCVERQAKIQELVDRLQRALTDYESISLPEKAVRDLVGRIQDRLQELETILVGPAAIASSREAMLDLLTARTLLTRASGFRNPEVVLAPKKGDPVSGELVDSSGDEASLTGYITAPFNYGPDSTLELELSGVPVSIALPGYSNAELRSQELTFPSGPTNPSDIRVFVNLGTTVLVTSASLFSGGNTPPWSTGSDAADKLDSLLSPSGVGVSWDSETNQLVFRSSSTTDSSALSFLADTSNEASFVDWAFGTQRRIARATPVSIEAVIEALASQHPALGAETVVWAPPVSFGGAITGLFEEDSLVWEILDSGDDAVGSLTARTITSPIKNFEGLGIRSGMYIVVTAPTSETFEILSVDGNVLTVQGLPESAVLTYYIGEYRPWLAEARVELVDPVRPANTGYYRISDVAPARYGLDRPLPEPLASNVVVSVYQRSLRIYSRGTTTTSTLEVVGGGAPFGLTGTSTASLSTLQLSGGDLLLRGVREGDLIELTDPIGSPIELVVTEVTPHTVSFADDPLPYQAGSWGYVIRSRRAAAFAAMQEGLEDYQGTGSYLRFSDVDLLVSRLINGARYTGEISSGIWDYSVDLGDLLSILQDYLVPREILMDKIIDTMREQGFDRAVDLFLSGQIVELFTMDHDGVSYATWLTRKAANAAREVAPVSKAARSDLVGGGTRVVGSSLVPYDPQSD